ncbi:MAG: hypothetical protein HXY38_04685 [Chloroflexi bacterium]|nr:hypothetical protein [Chloroflexota bacterium]
MKTRSFFTGAVVLLLVFVFAALNFSAPSARALHALAGSAVIQQATPSPQVTNVSEIGSTDGIMIMGIVIVLIITLPLIFRKRQ